MTPPLPPSDDREARLTALLLGELPPAEAEALRRELAADPDLRRLHDQLAATIQLVGDAVGTIPESEPAATPQPPRLADARRQALLTSFRVVPTRPSFWKPWSRTQRREAATLAAMLAGLLGIAVLLFQSLRPHARLVAGGEVLRLIPAEAPLVLDTVVDASIPAPSLPPPPAAVTGLGMESDHVNAVVAGTVLLSTADTITRNGIEPASGIPTPASGPAAFASGPAANPSAASPKPVSDLAKFSRGANPTAQTTSTTPAPATPPAPATKPARPSGSAGAPSEDFLSLAETGKKAAIATADAEATRAKALQQKLDAADVRFRWQEAEAANRFSDVNGRAEKGSPAQPAPGGGQLWDTDRPADALQRAPQKDAKGKAQAGATHWFFADGGAALAGSGGFGGGAMGGGAANLGDRFYRQAADKAPVQAGQLPQGAMGGQDEQASYFGRNTLAKDAFGVDVDSKRSVVREELRKQVETESLGRGFLSPQAGGRSLAENGPAAQEPLSAASLYALRPLERRAGASPAKEHKSEKREAAAESLEFAGRLSRRPQPANAPVPQPEVVTAENAFSTFSLNVSDVSFKLAAASLEQNRLPEAASVRVEEFINAFDYRDPEPAGSAPVALAWERARSPWAHDRDVMRLSVKTAASGRQAGRPLNLVLALDNSGSMERADRVRILQECLRVLGAQLRPGDRISLVAFARTARLVADGLPGERAGELPRQAAQLSPQGGTNLEDALALAWQTARRHFLPQGVNRVVLLTDGAANLGEINPASLKAQVEAQRRQGIALDCFGIGWEGYDDELMEQLSRNGDGRYGFINSPAAAASDFAGQLAGALQVAASDVKVQVEWNPRRVRAWRQIGYARHQLTREQFRDNTVDAAELGAAEAGNALYTVQVDPAGEGPLGTVRVRFKVPGTSDYRELEWTLPHDGAARALDQASPTLRLAATAGAFGEWLAASPFAAEASPDRLLSLLRGVPNTWTADPRPAQLQRMLQQAQSLGGK